MQGQFVSGIYPDVCASRMLPLDEAQVTAQVITLLILWVKIEGIEEIEGVQRRNTSLTPLILIGTRGRDIIELCWRNFIYGLQLLSLLFASRCAGRKPSTIKFIKHLAVDVLKEALTFVIKGEEKSPVIRHRPWEA